MAEEGRNREVGANVELIEKNGAARIITSASRLGKASAFVGRVHPEERAKGEGKGVGGQE